jgi:general secretion pathway protein G
MESIGPKSENGSYCQQCGASLAPNSRYCVVCYSPVSRGASGAIHSIAAGQVATTNRPDPAIVFLPDEHEAILKRRARRKLSAIAGAIVIVLSSTAWFLYQRGEPARQKQRMLAHREELARNELRLLADGLERFKDDVGRYPTTEEGLSGLNAKPYNSTADSRADLVNWFGPYVAGDYELDPWGNDYQYRSINDGQGFELSSTGPNGSAGGSEKLRIKSGQE